MQKRWNPRGGGRRTIKTLTESEIDPTARIILCCCLELNYHRFSALKLRIRLSGMAALINQREKDDRISIHLESIAICKTFSANSNRINSSPTPSSTFLAPVESNVESNESKSWFNLHKMKKELKCRARECKKKIPCPHVIVIKSFVALNFRFSFRKFCMLKSETFYHENS